ncbi:unnamed protein product [Lactuca saligna]|uniref:BTB domain-containing protein n=1 Tax=Lactuca saligna TaxID=75948 RepID=A0AA35ZC51_LACSI|nr:unnamed protein product [Lactuca saligna]
MDADGCIDLGCLLRVTAGYGTKGMLLFVMVYLGEQYVNNPTLSNVTLMIEGKRFYAHRIYLLASSDAFRAMFDGGYRVMEKVHPGTSKCVMSYVIGVHSLKESTITVKLLVFRFLTGCEHLFLPFLPFTCRLMIFQECSDYFPKIPHGLDPVSSMFKQHVAAEGTTLVKQAKDVASNKKAEKRLQVDPATWPIMIFKISYFGMARSFGGNETQAKVKTQRVVGIYSLHHQESDDAYVTTLPTQITDDAAPDNATAAVLPPSPTRFRILPSRNSMLSLKVSLRLMSYFAPAGTEVCVSPETELELYRIGMNNKVLRNPTRLI